MGTQVKPEQLSALKVGKTTMSEVIQSLGKPSVVTTNADGTKMLMYTYAHAQARASSFIPIVGAFAGGGDSNTSMVSLSFKDDVLTSFNSSQGSMPYGYGASSN